MTKFLTKAEALAKVMEMRCENCGHEFTKEEHCWRNEGNTFVRECPECGEEIELTGVKIN